MSGKKVVVLFVLFLLIFTLFKVPAALLAQQFELPRNIAYKGLTGTLWQGKIDRLQVDKWLLQDVEWQFKPSQLFTAKAGFDVKFGAPRAVDQISGKGNVFIGTAGLGLSEFVARAPAAPIKSMLPLPMGDLGGRIIVSVSDYVKGETLCQTLDGDLTWTKAEIDLGTLVNFGAIESKLSCVEQNVVASFDGSNTLGLEGQATVESAKKYNFDGYLKPDASLPAMVHDGLSAFGKMDSKGRYQIKL